MNADPGFSSYSPSDPAQPVATIATELKPHQDWSGSINLERSFQLIDTNLLTFEVCLYHQVLPMALEGKTLYLGMVDLNDDEALNYIRMMLAYLNCTLIPGAIASQRHKDILSAYLKHREKQQRSESSEAPTPFELAPIVSKSGEAPLKLPGRAQQQTPEQQKLSSQETIVIDDESVAADETVVIFSTPDVEQPQTSEPVSAPLNRNPSQDQGLQATEHPSLPNLDPSGAVVTSGNRSYPTGGISSASEPEPLAADAPPLNLELQATHVGSPIQVLATLPPPVILDELLARVLSSGIGRLFFERHATSGRVIWSQNGIIKAELNHLSLETFQKLILQLKRLHNLPSTEVKHTVRVESERFYDQQRLLLRLQMMPGLYGEEANLQILRGVALQFYQQRQLASLSRDAVNVTQQLQQKLNEIHECAVANTIPEQHQLGILTFLSQILHTMGDQLDGLESLSLDESNHPQE